MFLTAQTINEIVETSQNEPVFIFKHSSICPISSMAKAEFDKVLQETPMTVFLVVVQEQRAFSQEIANALDVPHQSPQAICLHKGVVKEVLSHYAIRKHSIISSIME